MYFLLKHKKILRLKMYMKYLLSRNTDYFNDYESGKRNIVVALAADYGNLGDVAITYAQTEFLKKQFPEANIIDFPISQTFIHLKSLKSVIKPEDIITIVGGGNMGDLYDNIEYSRQFIIKNFLKNKIICFPQTIDFSETKYGIKSLKHAQKVYSKHNNLTISAREVKSYEKLRQYFPRNNIEFAPDIVLSLDVSLPNLNRAGITFVLRSDSEKKLNSEFQRELISIVKKHHNVRFRDTHIKKSRMSLNERSKELHKILDVFKKSELVITDRLHGMIFCAITNTPCIAFDNSNKKVSGVYNAWVQSSDNIRVLENMEVETVIETIYNMINLESEPKRSSVHDELFTRITDSV